MKGITIGNWVEYDGVFVCVESQDLDDWSFIESIKPILINEKWLDALGFEFNGNTWQGKFDNTFSEWKLTNNGFIDNDENFLWNNGIYYKYVHQLQNLVFSLNEYELVLIKKV